MPMTLSAHRVPPERITWMRKRVFRESRSKFARRFWVSTDTVKSWEMGRRSPQGAALRWLCYWEREAAAIAEPREQNLRRTLEKLEK